MRLISCSLTEAQIRDRSKTETRRLGWWKTKSGKPVLRVGQLLCFVDKAMGLKPGQKPRRIAIVRVMEVRREPLNLIDQVGVVREGFPGKLPYEFVRMFCHHMVCPADTEVTVIRFLFIPGGTF